MSEQPAPTAAAVTPAPTPKPPEASAASPKPTPVDPRSAKVTVDWTYDKPLMACRFDPTGKYLFTSAENRTVVRWEVGSGAKTVLVGHESWVRSIAFSPDGQTTYTAGYDGRVGYWPTAAPQATPVRTIDAHRGWARSVAVSPDGSLLATGGDDKKVKLWKSADGALVREMAGHESQVYTVIFEATGAFVLGADLYGKVHQWELATGKLVRTLDASRLYTYDKQFYAHYGGVRAMGFSADGKELACGGLHENTNAYAGENKPFVMVFDWATGQLKRSHAADLKGVVWDLRFHPDGFLIAVSGGQGGGVLLFWKPEQEKEFHSFKLPANARGMDLHSDRLRIATSHYDNHARITTLSAAPMTSA